MSVTMKQATNPKTDSRRKKNRYGFVLHLIFLASATLLAILLCIFSVLQCLQVKQENDELNAQIVELQGEINGLYTKDQVDQMVLEAKNAQEEVTREESEHSILEYIKEHFSNGGSVLDALKSLYPDDLIVADKGYYFIPINHDLKLHTYQLNQFEKDDSGILQYKNDGQVVTKMGIDVSRYQEKIDWKKVAGTDISYVFVRVGVRGYTKGDLILDDRFEENMKGARDNGIETGVYFVTQAIDTEEAVKEAEYVLDKIEPYKVTYPIVIDVEDIENAEARSEGLTMEERTACVKAFCDTIKAAGYEPMIYGNMKSFMRRMNIEELEDYKKWIAYYDDNLYFPYEFDIWQYTDKGSVSGIKGNVDYNVSFYQPE